MKRFICFDLGEKTLGIAISDSLGIAAWGLENFYFVNNNYQQAVEHALNVIEKEKVLDVVIGLALNLDGTESKSSKRSITFKKKLLEFNPKLNIIMVDERMSTLLANRLLIDANISRKKRKKMIDMESAVVILETYLASIKK